MRKIVQMNENWHFTKENQGVPACLQGEAVRLPHTWTAKTITIVAPAGIPGS